MTAQPPQAGYLSSHLTWRFLHSMGWLERQPGATGQIKSTGCRPRHPLRDFLCGCRRRLVSVMMGKGGCGRTRFRPVQGWTGQIQNTPLALHSADVGTRKRHGNLSLPGPNDGNRSEDRQGLPTGSSWLPPALGCQTMPWSVRACFQRSRPAPRGVHFIYPNAYKTAGPRGLGRTFFRRPTNYRITPPSPPPRTVEVQGQQRRRGLPMGVERLRTTPETPAARSGQHVPDNWIAKMLNAVYGVLPDMERNLPSTLTVNACLSPRVWRKCCPSASRAALIESLVLVLAEAFTLL